MSLWPAQFHVDFPDGLSLDRLPVGFARGTLYITYVVTGRDWMSLASEDPFWLSHELTARLSHEGVGAEVRFAGGGVDGDATEQRHTFRFRGPDQTPLDPERLEALVVRYSHERRLLTQEVIALPPWDG